MLIIIIAIIYTESSLTVRNNVCLRTKLIEFQALVGACMVDTVACMEVELEVSGVRKITMTTK